MGGFGPFGDGWTVALLLIVTLYCVIQALRDFQRRAVVWGVIGLLCAGALLVILTTPIPTHAVKLDLIPPSRAPHR